MKFINFYNYYIINKAKIITKIFKIYLETIILQYIFQSI